MDRVRIALVGVGGFGHAHITAAKTLAREGLAELVAFAEPNAEVPAVQALQAAGARHYTDFDELLANEAALDLVSICTPIPTHFPMAVAAFGRGVHVLLEKPPVVRIQDFRELVAAQEAAGVYCAVGFNDVARPGIIAMKRRICEGALGALQAVRAETRWLRADQYYARSPWAGRTVLDGAYVLDGPLNNSNGHSLNLAAYLCGAEFHEFAKPLRVQGELYRANPIDGEDTNCLRALMDTGAEVTVHLTQCARANHPRSVTVVGEKGVARYQDGMGATLDGERLGEVELESPTTTIMRRIVEVIAGSDEPLLMPLAEAEGFVLLSNGTYESAGRILSIDSEHTEAIDTEHGVLTAIDEIEELVLQGNLEGKLFSELNVPWATATKPFDLDGYSAFPQRWQA